jgi:hypothetical protein
MRDQPRQFSRREIVVVIRFVSPGKRRESPDQN